MILKSMVVKMQIGIPNRLAVGIPQPGGSKLWGFFLCAWAVLSTSTSRTEIHKSHEHADLYWLCSAYGWHP